MVMIVYDYNGMPQALGEKIGGGGQGDVYDVIKKPNAVAKIFHKNKLQESGRELREKIDLQITDFNDLKNNDNISWPRITLFDEQEDFIGYAMLKAQGNPLTKLAHPKLYTKYFPNLDRIRIVTMLLKLLDVVEILHKNKVYLGDINTENIICNSQTYQPFFIDTDSYQIINHSKIYRCPVGRPEMTPLEHYGKNYLEITRTVESDQFSLAILMFQCLMLGRHPYDNIGGGNPVENLVNGRFPYGKGGAAPGRDGAIPMGAWYNIWSHLTYNVKTLFIKTLGEGVKNPSSRATIDEWKDALVKYQYAIKKGYNCIEVIPKEAKSSQE
jgi:DNA-binding helix-hairpin-helix protein with protein kinase domain